MDWATKKVTRYSAFQGPLYSIFLSRPFGFSHHVCNAYLAVHVSACVRNITLVSIVLVYDHTVQTSMLKCMRTDVEMQSTAVILKICNQLL